MNRPLIIAIVVIIVIILAVALIVWLPKQQENANVNNANTNANVNAPAGDTAELENVNIDDLSDVDLLKSDLETPEYDLEVEF